VRQGPVGQSRWPVVDTFARAIETSDFERRLQLIEADCSNEPDTVTGKYSAGPGKCFNV
jgi:hypothetical protein